MKPHPRLTPADEVVVGFLAFVDDREVTPEFDDVLVFLHPVFEEAEFVDDFLLTFFDAHVLLCWPLRGAVGFERTVNWGAKFG